MTNTLILYVGTPDAGREFAAAAEACDDYAYLPDSLMQALGMYITYFPHVIVIDMACDYAAEAYKHLRSVDAAPIFLLTDERVHLATVRALPRATSAAALLAAIAPGDTSRAAPRPVPNGTLHYA